MRNTITNVQDYLQAVREELDDFDDREAIVNELHNYIFDLANNISLESGKPVELAFIDALQQLESPASMAENFRAENEAAPTVTLPKFSDQRQYVPEKKISRNQTIFIAIFGISMVSFLLALISR